MGIWSTSVGTVDSGVAKPYGRADGGLSRGEDGVSSSLEDETSISWIDRLKVLSVLATTVPVLFGYGLSANVSGGQIFLADLLLPVFAAISMGQLKRATSVPILAAATVGFLGAVFAIHHGVEFRWFVRDSRAWVYLFCGLLIGLDISARAAVRAFAIRALSVYLPLGAIVTISATLMPGQDILAGVREAQIFRPGQFAGSLQLGAERSQSSLTALALCVLCACVGYVVGGGWQPGKWRIIFLSCLAIVFLAYARNTVVAVSVASILSVVVTLSSATKTQRLTRVILFLAGAGGTLFILARLSVLDAIAGAQFGSFSSRVLQGMGSEDLAQDPSVQWRLIENGAATEYIKTNPFIGSGFGVPYRSSIIGEPFSDLGGLLYVHNFYLALIVKVGSVGALAFLVLVVGSFLSARRRVSDARLTAFVAALGGILTANLVAPSILASNFAACFGVLLAYGWSKGRSDPQRAE